MHRTKRRLRYALLVSVLACLAICAIPAIDIAVGMVSHQVILYRLASNFARIPHPPGTAKVDTYQDIGSFFGDGYYCNIFVSELRTYTSAPAAIRNFYQQYDDTLFVIFTQNGDFPLEAGLDLPAGHSHINDWKLPPGIDPDHLYVVFFVDMASKGPGYDLRCG